MWNWSKTALTDLSFGQCGLKLNALMMDTSCGLSWHSYQLFELSLWHPFTSKDSLLRQVISKYILMMTLEVMKWLLKSLQCWHDYIYRLRQGASGETLYSAIYCRSCNKQEGTIHQASTPLQILINYTNLGQGQGCATGAAGGWIDSSMCDPEKQSFWLKSLRSLSPFVSGFCSRRLTV